LPFLFAIFAPFAQTLTVNRNLCKKVTPFPITFQMIKFRRNGDCDHLRAAFRQGFTNQKGDVPMLRSLKNLFRGSRGSQSRRTRQPFRPTLEVFEDRLMPSTMGLSLGHAGALVGAPAAPWLTATAVSGTQINLAWNHVAGANGYVVDEWMNGAWHELGTVGSNYTGCSIINLNPGTTYYFDVGAYNSTGTSWAYWTSATTSANTVTLTEPAAGGGYSQVNGSLFGANGPVYRDVEQGDVGDCWLLSSLAEVAARDPQDIRNMFTCKGTTVENGATVGLYSVRLFDSSGTAHYVTVDTELPDGGGLYDHPANGVLWVALAEKAYAEANGQGFVTTGSKGSDSYNALNDGDPQWH